jgi:capsule polysaccharide export protein KpsC/LpsZ
MSVIRRMSGKNLKLNFNQISLLYKFDKLFFCRSNIFLRILLFEKKIIYFKNKRTGNK